MKTVTLISKEECHLCDVAKGVLLTTWHKFPFKLNEVKIVPGDKYFEEYKERIPVVLIDGEFAFQYRVSEKSLLQKLEAQR